MHTRLDIMIVNHDEWYLQETCTDHKLYLILNLDLSKEFNIIA